MPTSAPRPTADIGCALVNTSASGPMPTSKYCDQRLRFTNDSLTRCASGEPGFTLEILAPISSPRLLRMDSASLRSPFACSSITRSNMLETKVTPQAFTVCKSHGAKKYGCRGSREPASLFANRSASLPIGLPRAARTASSTSGRLSNSAAVGATLDRS